LAWICPRRVDTGRTRIRHPRSPLRDVYSGQRAGRVCHAESGVSLCLRVRGAEHSGRPDDRLAGPEDPIPMSTIEPDTGYALLQSRGADERSLPWRIAGGLRTFARRYPLSAFWGCIAAAIVIIAIAAPVIAPYDPLKSDFRAMSKPP